jgi:prepilin-type N-terminal cleavage/methylation domain-containing protein
MHRMIERARQEEGFTLIELMIVIVILGVLAGIVLFAVGGITDRGTKAACKTDVSTVQTAVEAFYAKHGTYPPNLVPTLTDPNPAGNNDQFLKWDSSFTGTTAADGPAPATSNVRTGVGYTVTYYPDASVPGFNPGTVDAGGAC